MYKCGTVAGRSTTAQPAVLQVSEEVASVCAMVSIGASVYYRPKDKAVHAENAHRAFARGNVGDHIAMLHVYQVCRDTWGGCW
jgi:hypothetical protein